MKFALTGFGLYAGVRVLDFKQTLDFTKVDGIEIDRQVLDISETLVDGLVGARYYTMFADNWSFAISGDVSAGGTEFTWGGFAVLGYHFGSREQFGVSAGYRYLLLRFKARDRNFDVAVEPSIAVRAESSPSRTRSDIGTKTAFGKQQRPR